MIPSFQWKILTEDSLETSLSWVFPDGPVVKSLPCSTRDVGSIPGWGTKIAHAAGQLSPPVNKIFLKNDWLVFKVQKKVYGIKAELPSVESVIQAMWI